ncbi:MAG: hypothetical protein NT001_03665 [Candidatus Woesearchaeota archaeon]|nr:hypothetical protein [Candidatus Woesearchaeota archaeon]
MSDSIRIISEVPLEPENTPKRDELARKRGLAEIILDDSLNVSDEIDSIFFSNPEINARITADLSLKENAKLNLKSEYEKVYHKYSGIIKMASAVDRVDMFLGPIQAALSESESHYLKYAYIISKVSELSVKGALSLWYKSKSNDIASVIGWACNEMIAATVPYANAMNILPIYKSLIKRQMRKEAAENFLEKLQDYDLEKSGRRIISVYSIEGGKRIPLQKGSRKRRSDPNSGSNPSKSPGSRSSGSKSESKPRKSNNNPNNGSRKSQPESIEKDYQIKAGSDDNNDCAMPEYAGYTFRMNDFYTYCRQQGVIGKKEELTKMALNTIDLKSFIVMGQSGSGKTYLLNPIINLVPPEYTYLLEYSTDAAFFRQSKKLKGKKILIVPELQKIIISGSQIPEILKTLLEGRTVHKHMIDSKHGGDLLEQEIYPITIFTQLAYENRAKKLFDENTELSRRLKHIRVRNTESDISNILQFKTLKRQFGADESGLGEEDVSRLKRHFKSCMDLDVRRYVDPFAEAISEYIPETQRTVSYVDNYFDYLNEYAKINFQNRVFDSKTGTLFLSLEDHYNVFKMYHSEFCDTLKQFDSIDDFGEGTKRSDQELDLEYLFNAGASTMRENYPHLYPKWMDLHTGRAQTRMVQTESADSPDSPRIRIYDALEDKMISIDGIKDAISQTNLERPNAPEGNDSPTDNIHEGA